MNYLGHAYLSFGNAETLTGNMMGDFVKGMDALEHFPQGIRNGLMLHRHIDTFTDEHFAIRQAKVMFRPVYGLYSGAVVDTLMDHFIANDQLLFPEEKDLQLFAQNVYRQLESYRDYFPDKFIPYFQSMMQHNWLLNYRSEEGLLRALNGLKRRARHIEEVESAYALFRQNKLELQSYYELFMTDIISFVKIEVAGY